MLLTPLLQAGGGSSSMIMFALIFIVFYFFMIRPQQKKAKEADKFRHQVMEGNEIVTISGMHGKVVSLPKPITPIINWSQRPNFFKSDFGRFFCFSRFLCFLAGMKFFTLTLFHVVNRCYPFDGRFFFGD